MEIKVNFLNDENKFINQCYDVERNVKIITMMQIWYFCNFQHGIASSAQEYFQMVLLV